MKNNRLPNRKGRSGSKIRLSLVLLGILPNPSQHFQFLILFGSTGVEDTELMGRLVGGGWGSSVCLIFAFLWIVNILLMSPQLTCSHPVREYLKSAFIRKNLFVPS